MHGTQFAIREAGLYTPVLECAAQEAADWVDRPVVLIAGLSGRTAQACAEAHTARDMGYHAGMLSLAPMKGASVDELIEHCAAVAAVMPLIGFYLQTAVGGISLPVDFWQRFAAIDNVIAIKMAPFNRYRTLDVVRAVVAAGAEERITLYTGNDDHIVLDLLAPFDVRRGEDLVRVRIRGGLLGHWSVWTRSAVALLARIHATVEQGAGRCRSAGPRFARHRLQRRLLRRRARVRRLHPGLPRGAAAPGTARRHLVPGPERGPVAGPGRTDRPRLPRPCRPGRRRLRRRRSGTLAVLTPT